MDLEPVASLVAEQFSDAERAVGAEPSSDRFGKFALGGLAITGLSAVGAILYSIVTKMILTGDKALLGIALFFILIFAVLSLAWVVMNEAKKDRKPKRRVETKDAPVLKAETARLLSYPVDEPVPSVIEDTTKQLKVPRRLGFSHRLVSVTACRNKLLRG